MADSSTVPQVVSDPDFAKLSPQDQQGVLSHFDPAFSGISANEIPAVVQGIQKKTLSRPDLVAPPKVAKPAPEMETSAAGTLISGPSDTQGSGSKVPKSIQTAPDEVGEGIAAAAGLGVAGTVAGELGGDLAIKKSGEWAIKAIGSLPKEGATSYLEQHGSGLLGMAARHPEVVKLAAKLGINAGTLVAGWAGLHHFFGK